MSASALTMMIVGMVILWGGLAASIYNMVRVAKKSS
ncbi:methionine/alanine import family NSS transporter small subunit [Neobacillus niacini]